MFFSLVNQFKANWGVEFSLVEDFKKKKKTKFPCLVEERAVSSMYKTSRDTLTSNPSQIELI